MNLYIFSIVEVLSENTSFERVIRGVAPFRADGYLSDQKSAKNNKGTRKRKKEKKERKEEEEDSKKKTATKKKE